MQFQNDYTGVYFNIVTIQVNNNALTVPLYAAIITSFIGNSICNEESRYWKV